MRGIKITASICLLITVSIIVLYSCDKNAKNKDKETIIKGRATILVDETILPIIEDQKQVFENQYNAEITLIGKSESEIVQLLSKDKQRLAILTRELTKNEAEIFQRKEITARVTPIATDAIAFIAYKNNNSNTITVNDIVTFMQGKDQSKFKGLVFDNPNSSTVDYIKKLAKIKDLPNSKIFSFKTNNEVIQFVSKNEGMIGVVGVNWLSQPLPEMQEAVNKIQVLGVKNDKTGNYVKPNQSDIADGGYPLTRTLKMLNYQGYSGLGMGFASFMGGEIGQRIILKSGLVPEHMPSRNIVIRSSIEKKE